jgi:hypothetical protein
MTVETTEHDLTERIGVRMSPAQKGALQRIADGRGCSLSDLLRQAGIEAFSLPTRGRETTMTVERGNMPSVSPVTEAT